jgi:hypothetical protein
MQNYQLCSQAVVAMVEAEAALKFPLAETQVNQVCWFPLQARHNYKKSYSPTFLARTVEVLGVAVPHLSAQGSGTGHRG